MPGLVYDPSARYTGPLLPLVTPVAMAQTGVRALGGWLALEELAALWSANCRAIASPTDRRKGGPWNGISAFSERGGWRHINGGTTIHDGGGDSELIEETPAAPEGPTVGKYTSQEMQERLNDPTKWPQIDPWRIPVYNNRQIIMLAEFAEMHLVASSYRVKNAQHILRDLAGTYIKYLKKPTIDYVNISTLIQKFARLVSLAGVQHWLLQHHSDFVGKMLHHVDTNIATFRARQIAATVFALGRLGPGVRLVRTPSGVSGNEVLQKLVLAAKLNKDFMLDRHWSALLVGLIMLCPQHGHGEAGEGLEGAAGDLRGGLESLPGLYGDEFLRLADQCIAGGGRLYNPSQLSTSLWAFAKMGFRKCEATVQATLKRLEVESLHFQVADVALILWSLAMLHARPLCLQVPRGMQKAKELCWAHLQDTSTQDLTFIVWGLTGLAVPGCTGIFNAIVKEALYKVAVGKLFMDADIIGLNFSFARYRYKPPDVLLSQVSAYLRDNAGKLNAGLLSQAMYFVAYFGMEDVALIREMKAQMAKCMAGASLEDASAFAWSLAMVNQLDLPFLKQVLVHMCSFGSPAIRPSARRQMHQCLIHLQHVAKVEVPVDMLPEDLAQMAREDWREGQRCRPVHPDMVDVLQVLGDMGYETHPCQVIHEGPIMASIATLRDGTRIAVEIFRQAHLFVNTESPLPGPSLWRSHFLEAVGFRVLMVMELDWSSLSDQGARQYLAQKLEELNLPAAALRAPAVVP
ncbi:unnamed protein product [Ostreobium quekettii]|uniref:RAP domain-containing protein n=1 Tax=Ostreobium quekettii TaxID=121088 RepID=A0A8S1JH57_9CHLO|nr:unnamed protein product [Ostreobium quekettii]|eukprot:evm.model.scf_21EXC.19 EVM.evm.TU.scf_21EXC.19   scf_21EXC:190045-193218(+)